ncbi:MAG: crossover junction endodeoxyribonuclease RuvC [Chloroflexi bacterium]|nr:crossover junction endodeoxyribonuclease RuvC [Chloroflexota bacterium]
MAPDTVLGIDPGTANCGFAVLRGGAAPCLVKAGVIRPPVGRLGAALGEIYEGLAEVLAEHPTAEIAAERPLVNQRNPTQTIANSAVLGAVYLVAYQRGRPVTEYMPRVVKAAVAGTGAASKAQVKAAVSELLACQPLRPSHAADAAAVAICHLLKTGR